MAHTAKKPSAKSKPYSGASASADARRSGFFIVGVGASAGGLDALAALLRSVSAESMAFVIVQHLAPKHESVLPTLLARASELEVLTAEDGIKVERNRVYVIPPNADLAILQGTLHLLTPPPGRGPHLPIDFFFRSLAQDQGARAIGVVLSGTGSDGTFGLKAIKEAGGITFAQAPSTARYDTMPRSAIESGSVDLSLAPEAIGEELMRIGRHPYLARPDRVASLGASDDVAKLVLLIRTAFGTDLSYYKPSTIERRIERRLALHKLEHLKDYVKFVQGSPAELRALYKDILIGVTSFFRDGTPFEVLSTQVFPRMISEKKHGSSLRIWVPGCATGEEAYSIAICLLEALGEHAADFRVQVFGTDVDDDAVAFARRGSYAPNIALDVSPERLSRFFVKKGSEYQINRRVRDTVVFSTHNITKDAPFSKLDLVSCRNLLIYLQAPMQKRVLKVVHYALNPGGILLLGTSETVGDAPSLFTLLDRKNKLYAAKHGAAPMGRDLHFGAPVDRAPAMHPGESTRPLVNLSALADRKILELFGPPTVLVNEHLEVLHFRGRTGPYLEPAPGAASLNILRLARAEIHADLRRTLSQAKKKNASVSCECTIHEGSKARSFRLEVVPVTEPETRSRCLLVLFHEPEPPVPRVARGAAKAASPSARRLEELERELMVTKEHLQTTIEELESANEELKSSNEELQSSNEELQSTNEELETSKEELQSANEELTTVNDELQQRIGEQQQTSDDLHNLLTGVDNAVVITDVDLRIRRFTLAAERLLNLVPGDVGRSVSSLNPFFGGARIEQRAAKVIETLDAVSTEQQCSDGRWYAVRISPYKTLEHSIGGVILVLADIDARRRAERLGQEMAAYAGTFLDVVANALAIIDGKKRVVWVNNAFYRAFGLAPEKTIGVALDELDGGQWGDPALAAQLDGTLATGGAFRDVKVPYPSADAGARAMRVSGSRIPPMGGEAILILLSFEPDPPMRAPK